MHKPYVTVGQSFLYMRTHIMTADTMVTKLINHTDNAPHLYDREVVDVYLRAYMESADKLDEAFPCEVPKHLGYSYGLCLMIGGIYPDQTDFYNRVFPSLMAALRLKHGPSTPQRVMINDYHIFNLRKELEFGEFFNVVTSATSEDDSMIDIYDREIRDDFSILEVGTYFHKRLYRNMLCAVTDKRERTAFHTNLRKFGRPA